MPPPNQRRTCVHNSNLNLGHFRASAIETMHPDKIREVIEAVLAEDNATEALVYLIAGVGKRIAVEAASRVSDVSGLRAELNELRGEVRKLRPQLPSE